MEPGDSILLYDGVCGLCDRLTRFVLRHDRHRRFRFASLQSAFAAEALKKHGRNPDILETVYLLQHPGTPQERLLKKSAAMLAVFRTLGGAWSVVRALWLVPRPIRDWGYDVIARNRYRLFGKVSPESCEVLPEEYRERFIA